MRIWKGCVILKIKRWAAVQPAAQPCSCILLDGSIVLRPLFTYVLRHYGWIEGSGHMAMCL
jgi:hypothetical protein